jgi:predicted transposase YbfD/YdcC
VPAVSSSPIAAALEQLQDLPASDRELLPGECPSLLECLQRVPDPRDPRGVRHTLTSLLLTATAAVLAGAQSFTAIGEWVADAPPHVLAALGIRRDPLADRFEPPDEATIRRVLETVDAAALDAAVGSWLAGRMQHAARRPEHGRLARRALAVDGKSVRGTRHASTGGQAVHLLAVADQQASAVVAQASVDGKTNEITTFAPLLEPLDLTGCVITADALHTQREHAKFLVIDKKAHYILVVKKNQPSLYAQVKNLPWRAIPAGDRQRDRGHGREERRTLQAATVAAGICFPHAAQAIRVTRRTRPLSGGKKWRTFTIYAITSLTAGQATAAQLAGWIRGHWQIEALHHIRDVTYGEDASQTRTGNGPQVMATLRNLATATIKLTGVSNIAAACRHHARDATRTLATLGLSQPCAYAGIPGRRV